MIKISDIRLDGGTELGFPLSHASLRNSSWRGMALHRSGVVIATITMSAQKAGHFMVRVCGASASQCLAPVPADQVGPMLMTLADAHGVGVDNFRWSPVDDVPLDDPEETASASNGAIVYFLRAGPFIKIGKATGKADYRVSQLQTGCPYPIEVIGTVAGSYGLETELHQRFRHLRSYGEWFHVADDLEAAISDMIGGQQ